ncbi:baculoviral IAP repeat-containing protein 7-B-like [Cloeon dipterum]|uniref:baculoviral IAP repeat-containing protein 7-B-like n=1 Tax=Cloeon dipterum TaxID=197152 RepID=UPI0032208D3D
MNAIGSAKDEKHNRLQPSGDKHFRKSEKNETPSSMHSAASSHKKKTEITSDLDLNLAMHRFFTFATNFLQNYSHELIHTLAGLGLYYFNCSESPFLCCHFCDFVLSATELPEIFAHGTRAVKIIQDKHVCGDSDKSRNVPMGNTNSVLNYKFEAHRLYSLLKKVDWEHVEPFGLAKSGFYYTGEGDNVRCTFCNVEIRGWEEGDTPDGEHTRWSPKCPFLCNDRSLINIEIGRENRDVSHDSLPAKINIGVNPFVTHEKLFEKYGQNIKFVRKSNRFVLTPHDLNIFEWSKPLNPNFATLKSRINSFKDYWPKSQRQTPLEMAQAGFYYTGKADKTVCFHCNFGLHDWVPEDDPCIQHCRWNSNCQYLLMHKGPAFVEKVIHGREKMETSNTSLRTRGDNSMLCFKCESGSVSKVNLPCGHLSFCSACSDFSCAICGAEVISEIQVPGLSDSF